MNKRPSSKSINNLKSVIAKKEEPLNKLPPKKMVITKQGIEYVEPRVEVKKKDNNKYHKILANESSQVFKEAGDRVAKKELKWAYYTTENNIGVHYYLILNE